MKFVHANHNMIDLGGDWHFAYSEQPCQEEMHSSEDLRRNGLAVFDCEVPGNFELDLFANGLIDEPFYGMNTAKLRRYESFHIWYYCNFIANPVPNNECDILFEGIDCFADIYLNGKYLGSTDNMLVEHILRVDDLLDGQNELFVHIKPAVVEALRYDYYNELFSANRAAESLYVRKAPHMYGWDIMPRIVSAGIWKPLYLRFREQERIDHVYLRSISIAPDESIAELLLDYNLHISPPGKDLYEIMITGISGGSNFSERRKVTSCCKGRFGFSVKSPLIWKPRNRGKANLYDVNVKLLKNGNVIDDVSFKHGIRTVELVRTSVTDSKGSGEFCFIINGEKVFITGTNWVPADAFHSRDAERIPKMMELVNDIGCNMIRCWGGNVYESDRFYDICDENGVLVWQDFSMACALYPHSENFQKALETEIRKVVRRIRHHPCIVLWAGDNECDILLYEGWADLRRNPNRNVLTRELIPNVLVQEDGTRPYLPSSPYIDDEAFNAGEEFLPENHLWGPRGYYKDPFYTNAMCHFASEIGYHGAPAVKSIKRFISPSKIWPYQGNDEWMLHSTSPYPDTGVFGDRTQLMANQLRYLFGEIPDNLEDFVSASQITQAEAMKYFIEHFRSGMWRRTGIIWWNLIDGWPQFSDSVVDYYFTKKLAYSYIKRCQFPLLLMITEPQDGCHRLLASNISSKSERFGYSVSDIVTGDVLVENDGVVPADSVAELAKLDDLDGSQRMVLINWENDGGKWFNHRLCGMPPYNLNDYRKWARIADLEPEIFGQR